MKAKIFLGIAICAGLFLFGWAAPARDFFISNTNDDVSGETLRAAVIVANQTGGENLIVLGSSGWFDSTKRKPPQVFHLTLSGANEDQAQTGDLDITRGSLTIEAFTTNVVIDASALGDRVFQVFPNAHLTLQNLTITGGRPPAPLQVDLFHQIGCGGAIYNAGSLLLQHCIITGNASTDDNIYGIDDGGWDGGGIYNTGRLKMVHCLISNNSAGNGWSGTPGGNGGGVYNFFEAVCELDFCVFRGNKSGDSLGDSLGLNSHGDGGNGGAGGAIFNLGNMTLTGCTIDGNTSGAGQTVNPSDFLPGNYAIWGGDGGIGAGILSSGQLNLNFCAICNNIGGDGGDGASDTNKNYGGWGGEGGEGAGLYNIGFASLNTCTFSGNRTGNGGNGGVGCPAGGFGGYGGRGGAIYNFGPLELYSFPYYQLPPIADWIFRSTNKLVLSSCTIAGNSCGHGGNGGIGISGNGEDAQPGLNGPGGAGGGILNDDSNATVLVRNTLIASNHTEVFDPATESGFSGSFTVNGEIIFSWNGEILAGDVLGPDVAGGFTSQNFNLISNGDDSNGFVNGTNADQVGSAAMPIDPLLGSLQMNGGPTPTLALLPGSPAIDQGKSFGMRIDQRGRNRPYNNPHIPNASGGNGCDIGAYEVQPERKH